jgi:hypothetical protein
MLDFLFNSFSIFKELQQTNEILSSMDNSLSNIDHNIGVIAQNMNGIHDTIYDNLHTIKADIAETNALIQNRLNKLENTIIIDNKKTPIITPKRTKAKVEKQTLDEVLKKV